MTDSRTSRRGLLQSSAVLASFAAMSATLAGSGRAIAASASSAVNPIAPPANGVIPIAFPISDSTVLIDLAGPWEVFQNAAMIKQDGSMDMSGKSGFVTYTVAEKSDPVESYGGMKIVPTYTFDNAPAPKLIVIPAQAGDSEVMLDWIRQSAKNTDVTMSICTGVFVLAKSGLLSGKSATTHHGAYSELAMKYPDIHVRRGYRFVDEGNVASSGGLTCGIDLAFHIVERYFGRARAEQTALNMEYQGRGWMDATGADNSIFAQAAAGPTCLICGMKVEPKTSLSENYHSHTYYFCSPQHKAMFEHAPDDVIRMSESG